MTCDLKAVPRDRWNKRRTLSAVVIAVLPVQVKAATVRRNIILRDEHAECKVCIWGNHTQMITESAVGRPISCNRVCLQEYEGEVQWAMPKDCSISLGTTPKTAPIMSWLHKAGNAAIPVEAAVALNEPRVIAIQGMLAQVTSETITTKSGSVVPLTTVVIATGPPYAVLRVQFWNASQEQTHQWSDMVHNAVKVTMIRCQHQPERGNQFESIGQLSRILLQKDGTLEKWWLKEP